MTWWRNEWQNNCSSLKAISVTLPLWPAAPCSAITQSFPAMFAHCPAPARFLAHSAPFSTAFTLCYISLCNGDAVCRTQRPNELIQVKWCLAWQISVIG